MRIRSALALASAALLGCGAPTGGGSPAGTPQPGGSPSPSPSPGPSPAPGSGACIGSGLLSALGKDHLLVGLSGADASADAAPYDFRYQYLAGGISPGAGPCTSCTQAGCAGWWGCWQEPSAAPGLFVKRFAAAAQAAAKAPQIPMFTYYQLLQSMSPPAEGDPEVTQVSSQPFLARYLADFRFLLEQVGPAPAFVHVEPDFWGYAAQRAALHGIACSDIPAAVSSAGDAACAGLPDTLAGLGRCMIRMVRAHAPGAKVGLHASGWGTRFDVLGNTDPALDPAAHARQLAAFMVGCGAAEGDFLAADMSDRDAGYYQSIGRASWWDPANLQLPTFHQAFAWSKALAEASGLPVLWWQTPVGNMGEANTTGHWRDNRLDYAFDHMVELAASHAVGIAFGAGAGDQTTPETDGGNLARRAASYGAAGGQALCGP